MPTQKRPGVTGVYVELADDVVAELEELVDRLPLGSKADHIRLAVRRHLDSPPTVTVPPLPPATVEVREKPTGENAKGKKTRKGK